MNCSRAQQAADQAVPPKENEEEVLRMGYNSIDDIGLHSTRKGAASYLALIPGGPLPTAICLQGGWSMGQIKDIYLLPNLLAGVHHCSTCFGEILQHRLLCLTARSKRAGLMPPCMKFSLLL